MKSQISIEFMTGVAIMLFIYVSTIAVYSTYIERDMVEKEVAQQVCFKVATAIDAAVAGGSGYVVNVSLPYRIYKNNYNAVIISNLSLVVVDWERGEFACSITSQDITGYWVYPGKFSSNNINNSIYITSLITSNGSYSLGDTINISAGYFIGDSAYLNIKDSAGNNISGYPRLIVADNHIINDAWTPAEKGLYKISAVDSTKYTFVSEKEVEVI